MSYHPEVNARPAEIIAEGQLVGEIDAAPVPRWVSALTRALPVLLLLWLLLSFGGVHQFNYSLVQLLGSLGAVAVLWHIARHEQFDCGPLPYSTLVVRSFLWLALAVPLVAGLGAQGPLSPSNSLWARLSTPAVVSHIQSSLFLLVSFGLARYALLRSSKGLSGLIAAISVLTAIIALAHWLSDNGRLFWYFAPASEFISPRARWPFVNPDHLAHFLIPGLFLLFGELRGRGEELAGFLRSRQPARKQPLGHLVGSRRVHRRLLHLLIIAVGLLLVTVAVAGSLSRAAWLATSIGAVALLLIDRLCIPSSTSEEDVSQVMVSSVGRRRRGRTDSARGRIRWPSAQRWVRPMAWVGAAVIFLFFLNQQGRDLLADRLEYGLLHTKDDIRWQMYRDTIPVIAEHPLFGVGLGNWEPYFRHAMDPRLAGITPVYLHSEPLQLLAEAGVVGLAPLALLLCQGVMVVLRGIRRMPRLHAIRTTAMLVAVGSALVAACFDFPFRIPAITLQFTLLLAVLCAALEDGVSADGR